MLLKFLSSNSDENLSDLLSDFSNSITTISFSIPEQVYQAFDVLTRVVGYIMPLRLYTPIISLILGYWFILIVGAFIKFVFNAFDFIGRVFKYFIGIFG